MRLIIDTDAGVDDAQAIMMALRHPGVQIEAITTVTGNVHLDWVIRNVFTVLDLMHAPHIPVYRGADQPLIPGYWQPEVRVHGEDGLGNYQHRVPTDRRLESEAAAVALVRMANEAPGQLTLLALGPQTNIALACKLDPEFPRKIAHFVFMGGAYSAMGNTKNVSAEFNIFCDPEAALIALESFPLSTMVSWEATVRHPIAWQDFDALTATQTAAGKFLHEITLQTTSFLRQIRQVPGFLLPDPLAMAVT
ncbi:MAG: nucleoside hydrolase, partial [Chloroflexi bacterium]|nr:nucleoside hydrolase [Chloroflexota bacterium]